MEYWKTFIIYMTFLLCRSPEKPKSNQGPQVITLEVSPMAFGPSKPTIFWDMIIRGNGK